MKPANASWLVETKKAPYIAVQHTRSETGHGRRESPSIGQPPSRSFQVLFN